MGYNVEYSKQAVKFLKKLDRTAKILIKEWIENNLIGCSNPFYKGKSLTGDKKGYWRYRIENYKIICEIEQDKLIITIIEVGHRSTVYKRFKQ